MKSVTLTLIALFVLTAVLFSSSACSDKKPATDTLAVDTLSQDTLPADTAEAIIAETPMPKAADELFNDFFFNFAANRKLQRKRIKFPLPVTVNGHTHTLQASEWKTDHFFMKQQYYTTIFDSPRQMDLAKDTAVAHVTIERINLNKRMVKQYIFDRINGLWTMTAINEHALRNNVNTSFLSFYRQFSSDSVFQEKSLDDLVTFTAPDPDDDFSTITGTITPDQWPAFKPQLIPGGIIYNIIYGQTYKEPNRKYFVVSGVANSFVLEMDFRRKNGKWKLVKFNN